MEKRFTASACVEYNILKLIMIEHYYCHTMKYLFFCYESIPFSKIYCNYLFNWIYTLLNSETASYIILLNPG